MRSMLVEVLCVEIAYQFLFYNLGLINYELLFAPSYSLNILVQILHICANIFF